MEEDTTAEGTETPTTTAGDTEGEPEKVEGEQGLVDHEEIGGEGAEEIHGEHVEGEHVEGEHIEGEHGEKEHKEKVLGEGEELMGEEIDGEHVEGEEKEDEMKEEPVEEEEERYVEEPPPDPAAPFDFSDSKEALKSPFELRPDQVAEVELLWQIYQDYTPAYTDIDNYITEKELVYMMNSLFLMTYTPEQLLELIAYCVKPPSPEGHITYEQFLKMVTIRQRDFLVEDELRTALRVLETGKTGLMDREYFIDTLANKGHKLSQKLLDNLIKEVDITNDGTIGIEDVVGTMCIDLNEEDMQMLRDTLNPPEVVAVPEEDEY